MEKYKWYVEPQDDFTNEFISRILPSEQLSKQVVRDDFKKRKRIAPLWVCDYNFVTMLGRVRNCQLKYKVFKKELPGGAIVQFDPKLFSKKRKLQIKVKKALAEKLQDRS